jgi:hypothetical protein
MADDPFSASPTATKKRITPTRAEKTTNVLPRRNNRLNNREQNEAAASITSETDEAAAPITSETADERNKREKREKRNKGDRERYLSKKKTKSTNGAAANSNERLPLQHTMQSSSSSSSGRFDRNAATAAGAEDDECSEAEPPPMRARTLRSPDANAMAVDAAANSSERLPLEPTMQSSSSSSSGQFDRNAPTAAGAEDDECFEAEPPPMRARTLRSPDANAMAVDARRLQRESAPASPQPNSGRSSEALASGVLFYHLTIFYHSTTLNTSTVSFRNKCCLGGTIDSKWTPLQPLIGSLDTLLQTKDGIQHMSSRTTSYNNILSVGDLLPVLLYSTILSVLYT